MSTAAPPLRGTCVTEVVVNQEVKKNQVMLLPQKTSSLIIHQL